MMTAFLVGLVILGLIFYFTNIEDQKKTENRIIKDQLKLSEELQRNPDLNKSHSLALEVVKRIERQYPYIRLSRKKATQIIRRSEHLAEKEIEIQWCLFNKKVKLTVLSMINHTLKIL